MPGKTDGLFRRTNKHPEKKTNQVFWLFVSSLLASSYPGGARAECPPVKGRDRLTIGFLPALTANMGQSKHFVGAFKYALCHINHHVLNSTPYYLDYIVHDTKANTTFALRGMTEQYNNGSLAFIGPEDNCAIEARLAAAWNLPMISFKCRDSSVSNRNGLYPTFIRTIPSTAKVSKSLISLMKHFGWTVFQAIVGDNSIWREAAATLRHRAEAAELVMNPDVYIHEPYVGVDEMPALVESTYQQTRIYVFLGDHHALIDFVRSMQLRNLNNGEYLVIAVAEDPYDPTLRYKYFHKYLEDHPEEYMVEPFRSVIMLLPSTPSNPKYNEFLDESRRLSYLHPFYAPKPPFPELKLQVPIFAAYLYDAVSLYARVLKETLEEKGDIRNGSAMVAKLTRRTYESIQGHTMFIDPFGNAEANYTVLALLPDPEFSSGIYRRSLQPVGHFTTHGVLIPDFTLTREIDWISGSIPVSEPQCGFDGSKCNMQTDWPIAIICTVIASAAVMVIVLFLSIRHYIYEQKLASLLWKIDYKDLLMVDNGSDLCFSENVAFYTRRAFGRLSIVSSGGLGIGLPSGHFHTQVAAYKGQTVAVKSIKRRHIEVNRTIKKELHLMKEMTHDNINRFIGACIDTPHSVCIVTDYCQRGSLRDIFENNDIHLDDMFIASLVFDLIKGMIYLHDSEIGSHGTLRPSHCLVDSRWVLQIADFGLHTLKARDGTPPMQDEAAIQKLLWCAPELLRNPCAPLWGSQKGDVYSFGLILFELHSRCRPFSRMGLSPAEVLRQLKSPGKCHPIRPDTTILRCDDFVKRCMQDCWQEDEALRPEFKSIRARLKPMQQWMSTNIFDNMLAIMEKYATRLETLVEERTKQLAEEKKKTESLLLSMLPHSVAVQLIQGEQVIPEQYEWVTIYFSDIVDFTRISAESTPMQVVDMLNDLYTLFDSIIGNYDVYKVETIGDAYMVVSGLPIRNHDLHAGEIASMSLHLLSAIKGFRIPHRPSEKLKLRIGIHSGPVVAGVVGLKMPRYCLFGDTVNTASRMESTGKDMKIHCSSDTKVLLDKLGGYVIEERGVTNLKGKGEMFTYFVVDEDKSQRLRRISQHEKHIDNHSFTESALGSTHNTSVTESCVSLASYKDSHENNNYRVTINDERVPSSRNKTSLDAAMKPLLHKYRVETSVK